MKEPTPRSSRLALAAALVASATIGGGGFLLGQRAVADRTPRVAPFPTLETPPPTATSNPDADRRLARANLLALAATAADATARGTTMPDDVRDMVGMPFSIALPFGCAGPADADSDAAMHWRYDSKAGALRLHVAPFTWLPADWWPDGAPVNVDTLEGFWVARPWTNGEDCPPNSDPVAAIGADPVTLPGQTLAVAQVFGEETGRQGRRDGQAYTAVVRIDPDALRAERGFRVRMTGRIAAAPGGSPALCRQPGGAEQRPICVITTELDAVTIENAATNDTLATWPVAETRR